MKKLVITISLLTTLSFASDWKDEVNSVASNVAYQVSISQEAYKLWNGKYYQVKETKLELTNAGKLRYYVDVIREKQSNKYKITFEHKRGTNYYTRVCGNTFSSGDWKWLRATNTAENNP